MRTYDKVLNGYTFKFRLTIGKQREMREKFQEETFQTVIATPVDPDKMSYLLGAAADWPGNENPTTDGDEIYDLLVDSGVCGQVEFLDLVTHIAVTSGIIDERFRNAAYDAIKREWDGVIDVFAGESVDPTNEPIPGPEASETKPEKVTEEGTEKETAVP